MVMLGGLTACAPQKVEWTEKYAPDARYLNRSNIAVPVFRAPDPTSAPLGSVRPKEGGFIQTCNDDVSWCRISYGGLGASGWVNITPFFRAPV